MLVDSSVPAGTRTPGHQLQSKHCVNVCHVASSVAPETVSEFTGQAPMCGSLTIAFLSCSYPVELTLVCHPGT